MRSRHYSLLKDRPYTRLEYIHSKPQSKITKFTMGNPDQKYEYEVRLIAQEDCQISDHALEASRIAANRYLEKKLGKDYLFRILVYPHHLLREHRMLYGAGADRLQKGMKLAFGKPFARAARVRRDQTISVVYVNKRGLEVAIEALRRAKHKYPVKCRIEVKKIVED